jgi:hypothetical protein
VGSPSRDEAFSVRRVIGSDGCRPAPHARQ